MRQQTNKQSGNSSPQSLVAVLVLVAAIAAVLINHQSLTDYWQLHNYSAPQAVQDIAKQDTFTDYATKVLYVNHPLINQKTSFGKSCPDATREQTIVLGCYHSNQAGIFLLDVTDPRLNGVKQVTTAHEMLHAAYDRLSEKERNSINAQLMDYYSRVLKDERLLKTIDAYKKSEPKDVVNEMHSIFGTEIANLPPGLEQYYRKYFINRAQVARFSEQYQAEFTSRQQIVVNADAQLAALKMRIDVSQSDLEAKQSEITARQNELTARRDRGDISGYNAGVADYNGLIASYNVQVQAVRNLVDQYNALVASRNATALEEDQLIKSLSAEVAPINN